jgi:hypothetical protein
LILGFTFVSDEMKPNGASHLRIYKVQQHPSTHQSIIANEAIATKQKVCSNLPSNKERQYQKYASAREKTILIRDESGRGQLFERKPLRKRERKGDDSIHLNPSHPYHQSSVESPRERNVMRDW